MNDEKVLTFEELQERLKQLDVYSQLVARAEFQSRLGYAYGGDRDIYEALGYKTDLDYTDFVTQYKRQDIAKAVINKPVEYTWKGPLKIYEADDDQETIFEKAFHELNERLKLKSIFSRLDKLTSLGKYGVLLLGFDDVSENNGFINPVSSGKRELIYLKPLGEGNAKIFSYIKDSNDKRYGLPEFYNIILNSADYSSTVDIKVHYSRVLHIIKNNLESEVEGFSDLEIIFNRLKDLEKILGGSAEMFWRGGRPGYHGKVDPNFQLTPEMKEDLQDQIDEYEHNLRRILINKGIDFQSLSMQIADPSSHIDKQIEMISAVTNIPKRILTGSERGELASTQDLKNWFDSIQSRREEYAEIKIIRPFVKKCFEHQILPETNEYFIDWQDLYTVSDKDKAEVGKIRSTAIKEYSTNPMAEMIIPPNAFYQFCLGLDDEEIKFIEEIKKADIQMEEE